MSDKNPKASTDARMIGVYEADSASSQTWQVWTPIRVSRSGVLLTTFTNEAGQSILNSPGLDLGSSTDSLPTIGFNYLYDATTFTWNSQRNNQPETVLASAARTAAINSADFTNYNAKGAHIIIDVSALTAGAELTPTIQGKDPVSGNYYDLLVGLPITATGTNIIKIYPGITPVVNAAASDILPRTWRVSLAVANANSVTYSVGAQVVL